MKKADVKIGGLYLANVSGRRTIIVLGDEHPKKGWFAKNMVTGREIYIRSAQRLQQEVTPVQAEKILARWKAIEERHEQDIHHSDQAHEA